VFKIRGFGNFKSFENWVHLTGFGFHFSNKERF
jgi:hypothetical protein